jgi:hypothetical protein
MRLRLLRGGGMRLLGLFQKSEHSFPDRRFRVGLGKGNRGPPDAPHSAGFARLRAARFGALCPQPTAVSCQRSAQTAFLHDLSTSLVRRARISRPTTRVAKSWRKAQPAVACELADFFSPQEETQAS